MGDEAAAAQAEWDSAGQPESDVWASVRGHEQTDYERHIVLGGNVNSWNQKQAERVQDENPAHRGCAHVAFDNEFGAVCSCGAPLGWDDRFVHVEEEPVESKTTAAAATAKPVDVNGISSAVDPADPILATLDIIDPTMPYDARMVEEHLLDAVARLERGAHYERVCAEDYARFVLQYEMDYARAILAADSQGGAADVRKARAMIACERQYMERMIAKMKLDAIQGTMHSLRSVISSYQSVAKSVASSMGAYSSNRQNP